MGFPFDIGLTIVEGTHNGVSEHGFYIRSNEGPDTVISDITIMNGVADGP